MYKCHICNKEVKAPCEWSPCKIEFEQERAKHMIEKKLAKTR